MATIVSRGDGRASTITLAGVRVPPWLAVIWSRLIVLASGIAGATLGTRAAAWGQFDPTGISSHLGSLGNVLGATAVRWDSIHYLQIAQDGYSSAGNTVFFPMYPLLIHVVSWLVRSDVLSGVLISAVAFVVALMLLHRLTREELGPRAADATVLLLSLAPLSPFFTAVYTESLFLALSVGAFYLARRQRFVLASVVATAATLTRVPGILLVAPLGIMYVQSRAIQLAWGLGQVRRFGQARGFGRALAFAQVRRVGREALAASPLLLPVIGLGGLLAYLHGRGYGWLAPVTNQLTSAHGHSLAGPIVTLAQGTIDGLAGLGALLSGARPIAPGLADPFTLGFQNLVYLIVLVICVAALIAAWKLLPKAYAVYSALVLAVCLWTPAPDFAFRSIDRYSLVIFPLWMAAAAKLSERRLIAPVVLLSSALLVFYSYEIACWVFVA